MDLCQFGIGLGLWLGAGVVPNTIISIAERAHRDWFEVRVRVLVRVRVRVRARVRVRVRVRVQVEAMFRGAYLHKPTHSALTQHTGKTAQ